MAIKKRPIKVGKSATVQSIAANDLERNLRKAIDNDADEVVLRISAFGPQLEPARFQAIVRFSDRTRPWATSVMDDPYDALADAIAKAAQMRGPTFKERTNDSKDATRLLRPRVKRRIKLSSC